MGSGGVGMKNGNKTVGILYSQGFALLKSRYKELLLITLIIFAVSAVVGMLISALSTPVMFMLIMPLELLPMGMASVADIRISGTPDFYSNDPGFIYPNGLGGIPGFGDVAAAVTIMIIFLVVLFIILFLFIAIITLIQSMLVGTVGVEALGASLVLAEGGKPSMDTAMKSFGKNWKRYLAITAWTALWTTLWSLLLIFPGVIKGYSYRLAPYLMVQYPGMTARQALRKSIEITHGYKGRLFGLDLILLAFGIGAYIVSCFFFFIPMLAATILWITPLSYAMFAIAYIDIRAAGEERGLLAPVPGAGVSHESEVVTAASAEN
jgi:uncharacterized membrane protein